MAVGTFAQFKKNVSNIDQQVSIEGEIADLGPGELVDGNKVTKYRCFRAAIGQIINSNGCLLYKFEENRFAIRSNGELMKGSFCNTVLRLNSTHVIVPANDDQLALNENGFPSLVEEETILSYPPTVSQSFSHIAELLVNSSLLNVRGGQSKQETASDVVAGKQIDLIAGLTSANWFRWMSFFSTMMIFVAAALGLLALCWFFRGYPARWWSRSPGRSDLSDDTKVVDNSDRFVGSGSSKRELRLNI